ncbi:MAG: RluA family pseudouridine synthase, partial [Eubacteriaceae bacterium]
NKSPGVVAHPTRRHQTDTLANYAAHYILEKGDSFKLRFVNRLDMDTSGIIIIAKNKFVHHYIQSRMRGPDVEKTYTVWAEEDPDNLFPDSGTIDLPIGRPDPESIKRCVMEDGQQAVTHYRVLERYPGAVKLEVVLGTGRTHQIRVHLAAVGHPIIGDSLYNPDSCDKYGLKRQALHASRLKIPLPKRDGLELKAELPEDLIQLENRLRGKL